jgi:hypothetical protein
MVAHRRGGTPGTPTAVTTEARRGYALCPPDGYGTAGQPQLSRRTSWTGSTTSHRAAGPAAISD